MSGRTLKQNVSQYSNTPIKIPYLFFFLLFSCGSDLVKRDVESTKSDEATLKKDEEDPEAAWLKQLRDERNEEIQASDLLVDIHVKMSQIFDVSFDNDNHIENVPENIAQNSLDLAGVATSYSISLVSCLSGLTSTINQNTSSIKVYKYDQNCLAKLTSFTYNGRTYEPSTGDPFTTWQQGDEAIFEDTLDSNNTLYVKIASTLQSPVVGNETIEYIFADTRTGTSVNGLISTSFSTGTDLIGGSQAASSFTIYQSEFVGLGSSNEGQFQFILECTVDVSSSTCDQVDMADMEYMLVEDTYSGSPSHSQAETLFSSGGTTIDTGNDVLATNEGGTTHGGFITKSGASVLQGPVDLVSKPNLILFLKVVGSSDNSYQYFQVDVTLTVQ